MTMQRETFLREHVGPVHGGRERYAEVASDADLDSTFEEIPDNPNGTARAPFNFDAKWA